MIMEYGMIFIALACVFGFFMAWGVGANDVANAMGTSVGSKAITIKQAIIIATIFEFAGAFLAGGQVTATIRKGIIDTTSMTSSPEILVFGMLASLLAAGIWLLVASRWGWPVSTTHTIVGALVGFAIVGIGMDAVKWGKIGTIVSSWVVSPLLAGSIAYALFMSVQKLILGTADPLKNAKRYVPFYIFAVGFIIALVTLMKGLKHVGIHMETYENILVAIISGGVVMLVGKYLIAKLEFDPSADRDFGFTNVAKIFGVLMMVTACAMAFAHGSNDVANAIGPLAAINDALSSGGVVTSASIPLWVMMVGALGLAVGLMLFGPRLIKTVGSEITELDKTRAFCIAVAAAITVLVASQLGLPVSSTHIADGGVFGVGFLRE